MKYIKNFLLSLSIIFSPLSAQTLNVVTGDIVWQFPAAQAGEMNYMNGETLTILGKVFTISDITKIYIDNTTVTDNQVSVSYNGTSAAVSVSGNIAQYINATVSGAHVTLTQDNTFSGNDAGEIEYTLNGTSTNGEFYMNGSYKATVVLNGVKLTNPNGAAISIVDGKRIDLKLQSDTENTLTDGANGDQKGCLYVKGHTEFKGKGILNIYGNSNHGIKGSEYIEVKNCTINVLSAASDGINCNEYFLIESGTINISSVGDNGIQCDIDGDSSTGETTGHEDEDSGNIYIEGGTITVNNSTAGGKGIKAEGNLRISDGTVNVTVTGSNVRSGSNTEAAKGIKAEGTITISGGKTTVYAKNHEAIESKSTIDITGGIISATSSDDAINSSSHMTISGGYVMGYSTGNDGLDANGNMYIKGGVVYAIGTTQPEVALDANTEGGYKLYVEGGTIITVGPLESGSTLSQTCYQASWNKNTWYALYNDNDLVVCVKTPSSGGSGMVVSTSGTPTLKSDITVSQGTEYFNANGTVMGCGDSSVSGGSSVSLSTYSGGGSNQFGGGPGGGGPGGGHR